MSAPEVEIVRAVRVGRLTTTLRSYDAITVVLGDLHLHCDATDDRKLRLAKRLADSHGAPFIVTQELQGRVTAALQPTTKEG